MMLLGIHWQLSSKETVCDAGDTGSIPGSGRSPGEKKWQPTPVFLPGKSQSMGLQKIIRDWMTKQKHQQQIAS